jgi:hypothetical protein
MESSLGRDGLGNSSCCCMMMVGSAQTRFHDLGWMNLARTLGHLRCFFDGGVAQHGRWQFSG